MRREFPRLRQFPLRIEEVYLTPARELIKCRVEGHFPPDLKRSDEIPCRAAIERYEGIRNSVILRLNPGPGRSAVGWAEPYDCPVRRKRECVRQPRGTIWRTRNDHPGTNDAIGLGADRRSGDCEPQSERDGDAETRSRLSHPTFLPGTTGDTIRRRVAPQRPLPSGRSSRRRSTADRPDSYSARRTASRSLLDGRMTPRRRADRAGRPMREENNFHAPRHPSGERDSVAKYAHRCARPRLAA
jgi:hypothetical protein